MHHLIEREKQLQHFLDHSAWSGSSLETLAQDASFRRYFRLGGGPKPALLMDAPPECESLRDFVTIAKHLQSLNLSAPRVYHSDGDNGFAIIEDFGNRTFAALLNQGHRELDLYLLATDTLLALHNNSRASDIQLVRREHSFIDEVALFCDWFYPALIGQRCSSSARQQWQLAWQQSLAQRPHSADTLVLRDFHVDNAMLLADRDGIRRCGLLDFQDAAIGSGTYDLASLLEDARRDISSQLRECCLSHYRQYSKLVQSNDAFEVDYTLLAAQRHARVAGVFARLARRDNKLHYRVHLPRVTQYLRQHLSHPALLAVNDWIAHYLPQFDCVDRLSQLG